MMGGQEGRPAGGQMTRREENKKGYNDLRCQSILVENRFLLSTDFVRVVEDDGAVGPVIRRQLDDGVEPFDRKKKVRHEISRVDGGELGANVIKLFCP
jgi:hypothetical protein